MPSKSQAQRAWVYANKGKAWAQAHGFDNKGKLPARVAKKGKTVKSKNKPKRAKKKPKKAKKKPSYKYRGD